MISVFVTVAVIVALVAGCDPSTPGRSSQSTPPSASHASTEQSATGVNFGYRVRGVNVEKYRIAVTALYRSGPFMRLGFNLTCLKGSDNYRKACDPGEGLSGESNSNTYGGFYLVDPVRHQEYLPVQNGGDVFTSKADWVDRGKSSARWVVFPAAAKDAKTLDVVVPHGPVLENTPIGQPKPQTQEAPVQEDFGKPKDTTNTSGLDLPVRELRLHSTSEGTDEKQSKDRKNVTLAADVLFAFGKATLTSKAKTILDRVAAQMDTDATGTIDVTGYTDAKGSPKVNNPLSKNRAKAVSDYLKTKVKRDLSYSVTGKGEADPVAPNTRNGKDFPRGRAKNRRVTVSYKVQQTRTSGSPTPSGTSARTPKTPTAINWNAQDDSSEHDTYRAAVERVHRHGDLASLHLTLTCQKPGTVEGGCDPQNELDGSRNYRAGGFRLYQPSSKTRYYPVIDSMSEEWTSDTSFVLSTGDRQPYWIYFPAPEPGTTAIDVQLPGGGPTVHDVPVE